MILATGFLKCHHICSVNEMYEPNLVDVWVKCPRCKKGIKVQKYFGVRLSDQARNCKEDLIKDLSCKCKKQLVWDQEYVLILTMIFILNRNITIRDDDNMEKLTIDAICKYFRINDANIYEKHTMKVQSDSEHEFVKFVISQGSKKKSEYKYSIKNL